MKKVWMLALIALSVISCQKGEQASKELPPSRFSVNPNEPSYKLQDTEATIVWYVNFPWFGERKGEDYASHKIKLDTKTTLHLISGDDDRLNQMIAAGQLPDIITLDKINFAVQDAHRWAVPLNQLADAYDPYFYQVAKPDSLAWYTNDAGDVYGYPSMSNSYADFTDPDSQMVGEHGFLVRRDIYSAIGSPSMRTPEGFLQALRDAKALQPNIVPLAIYRLRDGGAAVDAIMNFLAIPQIKDGAYHERLFDEEYLIWLDVLRQAYQEGLIIDDNFAYVEDDFVDGLNQGRFFSLLTTALPAMSAPIARNAQRNPNQSYIAIDGPANRNMDDPAFFTEQTGISGWTLTMVTQHAKDKERAIQLITYLLSPEGHFTTTLGVEGESYYRDEAGVYRFTEEYATWRAEDIDGFTRETQLGEFWMIADPSFKLRYTDTQMPEMKQIFGWTQGKFRPEFAIEMSDPDPRSAEARTMKAYQENHRIDTIVRMIRSPSKEAMLQELEALKVVYQSADIQRAFAVKNEKIQANLAKLARFGY
ncbi:extracellular solute-binding protein [Entomospira culicis]|uniref:Extracellular solute-binding protein n=1 Tax=Entomospira culicis TaxID=2719989 RepID=A0A968GJF9_9SPIO|nr:extracellular solute-binding protein [Entomospira culicis]NIZ19978.1 extracellular solute-binding protein [Entomospira culicis]NIZ70157.1 extracellular solute-binding protein [Entomospira culicis]WDI37990.1 extracellular solute-binding protein [Entomospira culicis]WDI39613.1 extracellular solute-binding protein [Entomospira culicis]